jgi:excisionase family DNA binding protein
VVEKPLSVRSFYIALNERGFQVGRDTVRRAVKEGRVEHFRIGSRTLIPASELTAFPERLRVKAR